MFVLRICVRILEADLSDVIDVIISNLLMIIMGKKFIQLIQVFNIIIVTGQIRGFFLFKTW